MDYDRIGNYVNKIYNEKLSEQFKVIKTAVGLLDIRKKSPFRTGYCFSSKTVFDEVSEYFMQGMDITPEGLLELKLKVKEDIMRGIYRLKDKTEKNQNPIVVVKCSGFGKLIENSPKDVRFRRGHDYDQDIKEHPLFEPEKKVIIVSHIDKAEKNYEEALRSALNSQFRDFIFEFD